MSEIAMSLGCVQCGKLRDRIATLEAENARMRSYIERKAENWHGVIHALGVPWEHCAQDSCREARAALEGRDG